MLFLGLNQGVKTLKNKDYQQNENPVLWTFITQTAKMTEMSIFGQKSSN